MSLQTQAAAAAAARQNTVAEAWRPAPPRWERLRPPTLTAAGIAAATLVLALHDPHTSGSYGFCPFHLLTGLWCPGCGGLRATNDLAHGQLGAAASSNLLLVVLAPVLMVVWARWTIRCARGHRGPMLALGPRSSAVLGVVLVAFAVARNLPAGAWLAP